MSLPCDNPEHPDYDQDYDFEDVDCESCGLKFYVRPSAYPEGTSFPTKCPRCVKGLPPLYEY